MPVQTANSFRDKARTGVAGGIERRVATRRNCLVSAQIFSNGHRLADGVVKNYSSSGCRLFVARNFWLPQEFDLYVSGLDCRIAARMVWRSGDTVGTRFVSSDTPRPNS